MKFRKRPIVIDAHQWFQKGDHPNNCVIPRTTDPIEGNSPCQYCNIKLREHGWIVTLEGGHIVCPGDWIITGVEGEIYPCKPAIFEKTYEKVK